MDKDKGTDKQEIIYEKKIIVASKVVVLVDAFVP
jgi:hypothetical protein